MKVSDKRRNHILNGDEPGGGHGPGRGIPGKSEFPERLSDDDVINGAEDIANDPNNYPGGQIPITGPRLRIEGSIQGQPTTVIVEPGGEGIITAWPKGAPRNP